MGRKKGKTEIAKIKNEANRQVTFSKRKFSLFNKASELCTLCDANIALMVFSQSGKVYSFGNPNIDGLFDRLSSRSLNCIPRHSPNTGHVESNANFHLQDLNMKLAQVKAEKKKEEGKKKRYKIIKNERLNNSENWYQKPTQELNLTEAIHLKNVAEELKKKIYSQFHQRISTHPNYHVGSSSNVAPGTDHDGTYYTDHSSFDLHRRMSTDAFDNDPNMITLNQLPPFEYNHGNNNIYERFVRDCAVNRTPWYNHGQIQSQEPEQFHCQVGPRY